MTYRTSLLCALAAIACAAPALAQVPEYGFLDPMGPIAHAQRSELIWAAAIILVAVLPVLIGTPFVYWRYRRTNDLSTYRPGWHFDTKLEVVMWAVPTIIVVFLSIWLAQAVFLIDPYRDIDADMAERLDFEIAGPPVEVEVIGLDWKWLFLYPELGVASVGELVIPVGRPVALRLTTDTVMQSFMAPGLAGQIYAMPGMSTKMNLLADRPGSTVAENTQYNGTGFSDQRSRVRAVVAEGFDAWIEEARAAPALDADLYARVARSGNLDDLREDLGREGAGPILFALSEPLLYERVLARYRGTEPVPPEQQPGSPSYDPAAAVLPPPLMMETMQ